MLPTGEALPFGRHADVMQATPTEDEDIVRLVAELKRRGNAAFQHKSFEEAEALYSKAIEVNGARNPDKNQHLFLANRAAARCLMNKHAAALEDAEECVKLEPEYAKGYFRKAQALKGLTRFRDAVRAVNVAIEKEPTNKSAVKLLEELKVLAKTHVEQPKVEQVERVVTRVEVADSEKKTATTTTTTTERVAVTDEEIGGAVRGYKKLADGRVTTYFNNELTEEEKRLIGDIAPKKVEDPNVVQIKNVEGGSAWNQGNTFEERDMLVWGRGKLESLLSGVQAPMPLADGSTATVSVDAVKDINGIVSIAVVRGSKRFIFDLTFELGCKIALPDGSSTTGDLKFLDVSSDANGDYECEAAVPARYQSPAGKALHASLATASSPFRQAIATQMATFVTEFHHQ